MTDVIAGRFALCDPIARGGSGVVWRAYDRKAQKFCAAKVLRRRDAGDLLRFVREQSVRLSHPHVLTPYSWAAEDSHVAIASDLVDGGSLATLLGDYGALDEKTVAVLLDQLLAALDAVHGAGLVHRDVKPANVLLRASGTGPVHSLLSDFGLAMGETDARLTQHGMVIGTPGYVAPELLAGVAVVDARQDLYAAGRVAAALLTGAEPANGATADLTAVRDPALRELVDALTATNPVHRPPTAEQARQWLRRRVPGDPRPRTRDGEAIDVMHQLPPLPDLAGDPDLSPIPMAAAVTAEVALPPPQTRLVAATPHRNRRRWVLGSIAAAIVAGGGITAAILLTGAGPNHAPAANSPLRVVQAGSACAWPDQNDHALTTDGDTVTCQLAGNSYRWR